MKKTLKKLFQLKNLVWIALIFIVIIVFLSLILHRSKNTVSMKKANLYQYFGGVKTSYKGDLILNKNGDITEIHIHNKTITLDSTPIYYQKEDKAIFPKNMNLAFPKQSVQFRVNYFSTMTYDSGSTIIDDHGVHDTLGNAILFDGNHLYFLAGDWNVSFGKEKFLLSSLSYLVVDSLNDEVYVYDYKAKKYKVYDHITDDVILTYDTVKVNASLGVMYYNNKSSLFMKKIDILKKYS